MWSMMNLLETSLRVPLIIKPPSQSQQQQQQRRSNVKVYTHPMELLDLYPTLTTLAGIAPPPADQQLQGKDLTRAMQDGAPPPGVAAAPTRTGNERGRAAAVAAAYSQITRCVNCSLAYTTDRASYQRGCEVDSEDSHSFTVPCAITPAARYLLVL